jgi:starch-binding outer membrane protein, SusD/RagB family
MKLNRILIISALVLTFASCKKDIAIEPEQSLSDQAVFTSKAGAQSALLGVYSTAQTLEVFGGLPLIIGDYQADNVEFVGSFPTLQEIAQYVTLSPNGSIAGIWQDHYRVILRANNIIARVGGIQEPSFTDAQKNAMIAEAKFMRAITYFQLVNLFAQPFNCSTGSNLGVPLVLEAFTGPIDFPARATVSAVHTQIKKDLDEALVDLPVTYASASDTRGRATKGAARALLSRLHLYRGEWALAASRANEIITATPTYALASNYAFYDANSAEDVFSIQMTATDNSRTGAGGLASYHRPAPNARGDAPFTTSLVNAYLQEAGDRRLTTLSDSATAADGVRRRFTLKYPDKTNNTDNTPVIRVTEMYLNRAEALAELNGVNQASIDLINPLRTRAGLPMWTLTTFASKQALIDGILNERRKELAFEGHRRMDLLRRGLPLRSSGPSAGLSIPCTSPKVILPIPQREIDINPSLKGQQNPGY